MSNLIGFVVAEGVRIVSRPPRRPLVKRPFFRHCGLNTLLLNLTIPGSGNTLNLTLGQLQLG